MSNVTKKSAGSRRSFLANASGVSAGVLAAAASGSRSALAQLVGPTPFDRSKITPGDIAILKFLAAAEIIEDDLWQQYSELAVSNGGFNRALKRIDRSLVRYIQDDRDDERSHANLINAFLVAIGETPVNLDSFRTLPSASATGAANRGRLTSLAKLNVDTSWFNRYRGRTNPDLGGKFDQFVTIEGQPTVPQSNNLTERQYQAIAHTAVFHFAAIEQGGASLYTNLAMKVSSPDVLRILLSIGPTELYHFVAFHKSLERLPGLTTDSGMVFPDLRENQDLAQGIFPEPCNFLRLDLPLCSVVRPSNTENAGAVAAATGLVASGLFAGQSNSFFDAVVALATAADRATRT